MKYLLLFRNLIFLLIFVFNFNLVSSVNVQVSISETSSLTQLLNGQYSLVADGVLEIHNPSNLTSIYDYSIPITLDALIGINKVNIDSSSNKFEFKFDEIKGYIIEANETIRVGYHIFGLLSYDVYNLTIPQNISIFEYYTDSMDFSSKTILNLQKPQREGYVYNNDANLTLNSSPGLNSSRLISTAIRNPNDLSYFAKNLKLYKTDVSDPFFANGILLKTFHNFSIDPFGLKTLDFYDKISDDFDVYWVSSNVIVRYDLLVSSSRNYIIEQVPLVSGGGGSNNEIKPNLPVIISNNKDVIKYLPLLNSTIDSILIKKTVDKTLVTSGDDVKVFIKIVNINNINIFNLSIIDLIPFGYELKDVSHEVKLASDSKLSFKIDEIGPYRTVVITYTLKNKDDLKGITYLTPAELIYNNNSRFSDGVLLINDILPDKKVFIQKSINYLDSDYAKVTIKVKNLGGISIEDLLVSDFIGKDSIIREISKLFLNNEKGVWMIRNLKPGEEWVVSYEIERNEKLTTLPNIFGIDKSSVFGTLISSEEIITVYREQSGTIEKVGIGLAVGLMIFYLLF